ncbi:hypothetical protein RRG08_057579 [Elysia crispata]|uniref:Phospholipid scramblase n=1 Tax=Elysia crispata TaxID=231223 RepID=A0AAE1DB01_9GAST|nr:hypothetical protein RRG08_057579 [Elysia crispata]
MKGSGKPQRLELKRSSSTVDSEPSTSMFSDSDDDDDDDDDDEDYDVESVRSKRSARKQKETKKEQNEKDASKKIPAGLEALVTMDSVGIKANTELVEMMCGCEGSNNYDICNSLDQKFYTAHEGKLVPSLVLSDQMGGVRLVSVTGVVGSDGRCKTCFRHWCCRIRWAV